MDDASQIKREFGEVNFDTPVIIFRYQRIDIDTERYPNTTLNIIILFFLQLIFLLIGEFPLILHVLLFATILFFTYQISSGSNKIEIDFSYKRIRIQNHFPLIRWIHKYLKIPTELFFHDIAEVTSTTGIYYGRNQMREFLLIKLVNRKTKRLAQFNSKMDCQKLAGLLKQHILNKPN